MNKIFCNQCQHCKPLTTWKFHDLGGYDQVDYTHSRCSLTDLVSGGGDAGRFCVDERADPNGCGKDARNFVQKTPIPVKKPTPPKGTIQLENSPFPWSGPKVFNTEWDLREYKNDSWFNKVFRLTVWHEQERSKGRNVT